MSEGKSTDLSKWGRVSLSIYLVCQRVLVIFIIAIGLQPIPTQAESVPPHIVSMTKELLLATRDNFTSATGNDEQAQRLQRVYRILKREGLNNWHKTPFTRESFVPKMAAVFGLDKIRVAETKPFEKFLEAQTGGRVDAAIDQLYTALGYVRLVGNKRQQIVGDWNKLWDETWKNVDLEYEIEASRGSETILLTWDNNHGRYLIQVTEEDGTISKAVQTTITGVVQFSFNETVQNLIVSVKPIQMPITSADINEPSSSAGLNQDQDEQPITALKDSIKKKTNDDKSKKNVVNEYEKRSDKQAQDEQESSEINGDTEYVWENTETGEKIRQKRFRKLKEPFEYLGEKTANSRDTGEVLSHDRKLDVSETETPSVLEIENLAVNDTNQSGLSPPGNSVIRFTKAIYNNNELIVANYRVGEDDYFRISMTTSGGEIYPSRLDWKKSRVEWEIHLEAGEPYRDYTVALNEQTIGHLRVVQFVPPSHGAIQIQNGQYHEIGHPINVQIMVPDRRWPNGKTQQMELHLVRLAEDVHGGAIRSENLMFYKLLDSGANEIELLKSARMLPGPYELRLVQEGFVIDRQQIGIVVSELPGALRFVEDATTNRSAEVIFDAPTQHIEDGRSNYSLRLVSVADSGLRTTAFQYYVPYANPDESYIFGVPLIGGQYKIQLLLNRFNAEDRIYLLDELDLHAGAVDVTVDAPISSTAPTEKSDKPVLPFVFTIAGNPQFGYHQILIPHGEPIPVMVDLSGMQGSSANLTLYSTSEDPFESMAGPRFIVPEGVRKVKSWQPGDFDKNGWEIEQELDPGYYYLSLALEFMGQTMPLLSHPFEVITGKIGFNMSLDGREFFTLGEVPEASWDSTNGSDVEVNFTPLGKVIPGCAIEYITRPLEFPGIHLASLYRRSLDLTTTLLLDQVGFDLLLAPTPNAIKMAKTTWGVGEPVYVSSTLPDGHPMHTSNLGRIIIVQLGSRVAGGSESIVKDITGSEIGSDYLEYTIQKPGYYEARLLQAGGGCPYHWSNDCYLLDRFPFRVVAESPFTALDGGLEELGIVNDLPSTKDIWPPFGESASIKDCQPRVRMQEKMNLHIVQWVDGNYQPIVMPVNFGDAFYVEGHLEAPATKEFYTARIGVVDNFQQEVRLFRDESDSAIVRSKLIYAIWESNVGKTDDN